MTFSEGHPYEKKKRKILIFIEIHTYENNIRFMNLQL